MFRTYICWVRFTACCVFLTGCCVLFTQCEIEFAYAQTSAYVLSLSLYTVVGQQRALDKEYLMITEGSSFLFLIETICFDPLSESSRRDGSDEGSQHRYFAELTKSTPNYHKILFLMYSSETVHKKQQNCMIHRNLSFSSST